MNKINILKYTVISLFLILSSCKKDFLENTSKQNINDAVQFSSDDAADLYLNNCYNGLWKNNNSPDQPDLYTDDCDATYYWPSANWKQGNVTPENIEGFGERAPFHYNTPTSGSGTGFDYDNNSDTYADLTQAYTRIRNCNTFIQQVKKYANNFSKDWMNKRIDEAKFLRAFTYSFLFMHYGGVPIITQPQSRTLVDSSELKVPRSTFEETFNFITSQLDSIVKNNAMPVKYNITSPDAGRATLGAALALKGWIELFAASPAFNATVPAACNGTGASPEQVKLTGFGDYDINRWAKAAATNKQFIDSFGATKKYQLFTDLAKFWTEENEYNSEVIFDRQHLANSMWSNFSCWGGGPVHVHNKNAKGEIVDDKLNWGNYDPTEELIDDYSMANGKHIEEAGSGYDPQKPYVGRDPRFYMWVVYDGAPYKLDWMTFTDTIYYRINKVHPELNELDFRTDDRSNTGYNSRKRVNPKVEQSGGGVLTVKTDGLNYVFFRYAEVLLNYAEAQNEATGPDATVYDAIDQIRIRAGIPTLEATYGTLSKDQMRDIIHRERRVELSFENKRIYDIIRWRIAEVVLNETLHAMVIRNTSPSDNSGVWHYQVDTLRFNNKEHYHVFLNKMYLLPFSQQAINRNSKLIQNPGY